MSWLQEVQIVKQQNLCGAAPEALDQAAFKWLLNIRSQNVPLSGPIIQGLASNCGNDLNIEDSKALGYWLCR